MAQYLQGSEEFVNKILEKDKKKHIINKFSQYAPFIVQQNSSNANYFIGFSDLKHVNETRSYKTCTGVWRIKFKNK